MYFLHSQTLGLNPKLIYSILTIRSLLKVSHNGNVLMSGFEPINGTTTICICLVFQMSVFRFIPQSIVLKTFFFLGGGPLTCNGMVFQIGIPSWELGYQPT